MPLFVYFDLKDFILKLLQTVEKPTVFEHCKSEKKKLWTLNCPIIKI